MNCYRLVLSCLEPLFIRMRLLAMLCSVMLCSLPTGHAFANQYNALQECMKLSDDGNDINACMDNYLDLMDDNIQDISEYIARELGDAALDQFQLSQQTFIDFRKQNCLWYLEFSSPRETAELVAKNCLARMSADRLAELQTLIATDRGKADTLRGFYVYGANRNSFQPCGSEQRYWVEGDSTEVGQLQQDYLALSTASLQVLYTELRGQIESNEIYPEHSGSVRLVAVNSLKLPSDSECSLPRGSTANNLATLPEVKPTVVPEPEPVEEQVVSAADANESEQVLRAYFGDWTAECQQKQTSFSCELSVGFTGGDAEDGSRPELVLSRRANQRTLVYMQFPEREIDDPAKIRWRVDNYKFGDIVGSNIRVDETGTEQLVHEKKFIRDDLMPLFMGGGEVGVEVLNDIDDNSGDTYAASLKGLTRAVGFADSFVSSGGKL